jgi:hypothetical protein
MTESASTQKAKAQAEEAKPKKASKPADVSDILAGSRHWTEYRNVDHIRAVEMEEDFSASDAEGEAHTGKAGDYLAVHRSGKVRVIPIEEFQADYKPLAPSQE